MSQTPRQVLILVENLPVPLDRRVWLEATSLTEAGYEVSVICPTGRGWDAPYEEIEGVHIYRFPEPPEAHSGALAYAREWGGALIHMMRLSRKVRAERGFQVIHGCNPPDLLFLVALPWRLRGVRYLFDHHDVCPELFEAKFGKRGLLYRAMRLFERMTFALADVSIATNESFREIAIRRGKMAPEDVFVVRSAPRVDKFVPAQVERPEDDPLRFGYVGVIGQQEGMDLLVEAAEHLVQRLDRRHVHFDIVGFGPHLDTVRADVTARGLDPWFTFHGPLYNEDLLAVLNRIDIGVAPDPKNAMNDISTMNKIMEYMTLEKASVQFDLKEGRASAGEAGLYARANDPKDFAAQMAALIDAPEQRAEMGRLGRARVLDNLSWTHSAPRLIAAYERIFSKLR
ncbi:glycosyltransferase family 4 protein [Pseudoroseicyclus aestuarii]|uniref:Glycosyltransferase involved in cell wall biosynthesis n=1 Tax=Pseudoroseicyclus aestuarii TaxID=1795041 RepID=A0A318SSW2_9RHOB|nr:glycosyltransferase family 4 protein [Pseudoroseicyclus aestuarii]PYE82239.1 glycosyltransferase involved in cell wall biosynthesis [Pseudoroseicyclus aestuarii]